MPLYLTNYVIEPWPGIFVGKILAWEFVAALVPGTVVAALAKNDGSAAKSAATG